MLIWPSPTKNEVSPAKNTVASTPPTATVGVTVAVESGDGAGRRRVLQATDSSEKQDQHITGSGGILSLNQGAVGVALDDRLAGGGVHE